MKKIPAMVISLLIVLVIAFGIYNVSNSPSESIATASASGAQEFVLRNGIHFGDTIDVVREKETQLSFKSQQNPTEEEEYSSLIYTGTISGIEESTAEFKFLNGELKVIVYELGESYMPSAGSGMLKQTYHSVFVSQFDEITAALTAKYGSPAENENIYGFYGETMDSLLSSIAFSSVFGTSLDYDDIRSEEWFIQVENGYVKIDNVYTEEEWAGGGIFEHTLEYTFISESEFNEKIQSEVEEAVEHAITVFSDI